MEEETNNQIPQEGVSSEGKPSKDVSFPRRKEKKGSKKGLKILVIVIILLVVIGGAYYLLTGPNIEEEVSVTPTPFSETSPTPTEVSEEVIRDGVEINVLNGTGISGAAGDLLDELESLGYSSIEVGNAESQDYEAAEVTFASGVASGVRDEITAKLKGMYEDVDVTSDTLTDFDIEIITGYPKGYTPTVTEAPKSTATPTTGVTGTITPTSSPTQTTTP